MTARSITCVVLIAIFAVGLSVFFAPSNVLGQSGKETAKDIYAKATDEFASQNYKEALILYQTLVRKYDKDPLVKSKIKEIDDKISQCEQQLGIVNDITKILNGKPKLEKRPNGDKVLKLFYDFSNEEDTEDFKNYSTDSVKIENQALVLRGLGGAFSIMLKDVIFMNEITVEYDVVIVPPTDREAWVRIFFDPEQNTGYLFTLRYRENEDDPPSMVNNYIKVVCGDNYAKTRPLAICGRPKVEPGKKYSVKIAAKANQLSFYVNNELLKTVTDKTYYQGIVSFGGYKGCVQYDNIKIEGVVNPSWLDKAFSSATTKALSEKERDLPESVNLGEVKMDLSAEAEDLLKKIPEDIVEKYKQAKAEMLKLPLRIRSWREIYKPTKEALKIFDGIVKYCPDFAAAYYQKALCSKRLGEMQNALDDFTKAIEKFSDFYEAYCKRGDIYLELSQYNQALADYEKSISLKSDYSLAYSGRGYIRFILNERNSALDDLNKAIELDGSNTDARDYKKNLEHVVEGPLWPISFDKETEHYKIKTDISQDKCNLYGGQLETMYKYYVEMFDIKGKELQQRKKQVYIFNTQEGYQTYSELSTEDRAEYTLGYYHPHYQELLVFERATKEAQVIQVLYHEGFHMFIDSYLPAIPIWLNEGFAEYFYGTQLTEQGNAWTIAKKGLMTERTKYLQPIIDAGGAVSFEEIMNESREEFYSAASLRYGQAWSIIHFFLHYKQGLYKNILIDYIKALKKGKSQMQAHEDTFKKQDTAKLQKEWMAYIKSLKTTDK